ncbi:ATP-binding protein [Clostridium sp.]|uniref:ATP-binding protein n=1 Tax=Clostridium sp. TaxID=1506 RepID=UPI003D6CBEFD
MKIVTNNRLNISDKVNTISPELEVYKNIFNNAKDIFILSDNYGNIINVNKEAIKSYGYSFNEFLKLNVLFLRGNKNVDFVSSQLKKAKSEGIEFEALHYRKDRTTFLVEVKYIGIELDSKEYLLGIVRDITEMKINEKEMIENYEELNSVYEELTATEEELRANYEELIATEEELKNNYFELEKIKEEVETANKTKDQFIANISHEIRTPMNGILGMQQLLELTEMNSEQQEYLGMIKSSTYHLLSIINNILDISKIESGNVSLNNTKFSLKEFLIRIIKELTIGSEAKELEIMYFSDPFINNDLIGDVARLNQILTNLISNAIKFTEMGHIIFRVNKASQSNDKLKLKFSIEDTGIGMSQEFKERIFKLFNQEDLSFTKKYEGTGLGLAISKQLVEMMNGEIWYESELKKGSTFYFTAEFLIDIKKNDKQQVRKLVKGVSNNLNKKIILIIEDNTINMKIASEYLKLLGYNYLCAKDGQEGVRVFNENKIDLILMDIQMPIMNGFEASTAIRELDIRNHKHTQIIAMTAYAMVGDREKFIEFGMDDYISKPFAIHDLDKLLKKIFKEH